MDTGCTNLGESDEVRNLKKKLLEKESEIESLKHFIGTIKKTADERTSSNEMPISMDDWSTIDVCKWFTTLDLSDYISLVVKNKIDGLLLQNLSNQDWAALGIDNTFHIQKIRVSAKPRLSSRFCATMVYLNFSPKIHYNSIQFFFAPM